MLVGSWKFGDLTLQPFIVWLGARQVELAADADFDVTSRVEVHHHTSSRWWKIPILTNMFQRG